VQNCASDFEFFGVIEFQKNARLRHCQRAMWTGEPVETGKTPDPGSHYHDDGRESGGTLRFGLYFQIGAGDWRL
jgi:hypothetical protein